MANKKPMALRFDPVKTGTYLRHSLTNATKSNAGALFAANFSQAFIRFGSNLILTRILMPEDFGVMMIVYAVLTTLALLSETGSTAFVIRDEHGADPNVLNTVRTLMIARGMLIGGIVFTLASPLANLFDKPELVDPFRVMALVPAIEGFLNLRFHLVTRERRQRFNEAFELSVFVATTLLTIALALWLRSYWAFIYAGIATALMKVIGVELFYKRVAFRPMLDAAVIRRLISFSSYIFFSTLLSLVVTQADKVIVGRAVTLEVAGVYGLATTLTVVLTSMADKFARRVFYADAAASVRERGTVPGAYYDHLQKVRCLLLFVFGGGLTFGETFFAVFFDDRYALAGVIFSVLVFKPILKIFAQPPQAFIVATGQTRVTLIASALRCVHIIILAPWMFHQFGLMGLVGAVATLDIGPALYLNAKLIGAKVWQADKELIALAAIGAGALTGWVGKHVVLLLLSHLAGNIAAP